MYCVSFCFNSFKILLLAYKIRIRYILLFIRRKKREKKNRSERFDVFVSDAGALHVTRSAVFAIERGDYGEMGKY